MKQVLFSLAMCVLFLANAYGQTARNPSMVYLGAEMRASAPVKIDSLERFNRLLNAYEARVDEQIQQLQGALAENNPGALNQVYNELQSGFQVVRTGMGSLRVTMTGDSTVGPKSCLSDNVCYQRYLNYGVKTTYLCDLFAELYYRVHVPQR